MPIPNNKNWSEFDWERELRKDDERINSYMNELSKFIDLPGEEDIILKSLQNHSKAVPQSINFSPESENGLNGNEVYVENSEFSSNLGQANNLNDVNFSGNFGLDFDYSINKNLFINVAPIFKVYGNTFSNNTDNFEPYAIGIYTGINYRFD